MDDRRNPYLILGLDFGATTDEASRAFAKKARELRRSTTGPYTIEDATWALHQIERAETDHHHDVTIYRVPADPSVFEVEPPDAEPLTRTHPPDPDAWRALEAEATFDILQAPLRDLAADGIAYSTGADIERSVTRQQPSAKRPQPPPPGAPSTASIPSPPSAGATHARDLPPPSPRSRTHSAGQGLGPWGPAPARNFADAVETCFSKYASFRGRASRSEFWYFALFCLGVLLIGSLMAQAGSSALATLIPLALVLPFLAAATRRLHDAGNPGPLLFFGLVPYVGWIVPTIFLLQGSQPQRNKYG